MKKLALVAVLAMLPAVALAQTTQHSQRGNANRTDSQRGVSPNSPGQQMQARGSKSGQPGASGYAPGQTMQEKGSAKGKPGASGYAPGTSAKQR